MIVKRRDPFGFDRIVYHSSKCTYAGSIRTFLQQSEPLAVTLDRRAIAGYLTGNRIPGRTFFHEILAVPPEHLLIKTEDRLTCVPYKTKVVPGDLETLVLEAIARTLRSGKNVAIALSGGLDSALLLTMLRAFSAYKIPAYILAANIPGYGELDAALATAQHIGVEVVVVHASATDFVAALPDAIRDIEEPLYNLHPVAKLLLAQAMRRDGIELAISGDGADQVINRDRSADYLPLCKALFHAAGVDLYAPFLDADVVAHLLGTAPDPDKKCLRDLGEQYGLPLSLIRGRKRSGFTPPMNIEHLLPIDRVCAFAQSLELPMPNLHADSERVLWATSLLLLDSFGVSA